MVNDGDGPYGPVVNGTQIVFYEYRPNRPAGWAFLLAFAAGVLGHIGYMFWLRAWHFLPFILGGVGEAFGYCGRAKSSGVENGAPGGTTALSSPRRFILDS